jgi:hypothetical protein
MASQENRCDSKLTKENPDWNWEYWEAQVEGYEKAFKKPVWRDFLQTQKAKLDKVHDFFWTEEPKQAAIASGEALRVPVESEVS